MRKNKMENQGSAKPKRPFYKKKRFIILGIVVLLFIIAGVFGEDDEKTSTDKSSTTEKVTTTEAPTTTEKVTTTEAPTTTEKVTTTEVPTTTEKATEIKKTKKDYKSNKSYKWYMRNGSGGEPFSYTMEVTQKISDDNSNATIFLCNANKGYGSDMVFVGVDTSSYTKKITGGKRIIEGDKIRVYGEFVEVTNYKTAIGGSKDALMVRAVYVDIK